MKYLTMSSKARIPELKLLEEMTLLPEQSSLSYFVALGSFVQATLGDGACKLIQIYPRRGTTPMNQPKK